ncbi:iterative type I polyketide synthase [Biscogniauxia marginata]|nr:iterative type I polyketide synthase [Biscogniauxia marginata]
MGSQADPIAIIGIATRFPEDANTTEGLWNFLLKARSAFKPFPEDRIGSGHYHPSPDHRGSHAVRGGHFLAEDPALFDAPFFNITRSECAALDPQQRLVLENVYHALENAGIALHDVTASDTSVYVSGFNHDHLLNLSADPETALKYRSTGTTNSLLSNRVSWFYDLKGPSMTLDTACSSSMVALHLACQSLSAGESSLSIVSGVTQISYPTDIVGMSNHGFLGQQGKCFSFDHRADGYARGEGVGSIIVKRLSDAVRDGDTIRAVIRASGVNQDGRTPGISLPSSEAQEKLIRKVYASAGLDMKDTLMVEAHGTGTPAGDPIEAAAIARSFSGRSKDNPIFIGALKSGVGHLEGGAGVAGVIKSILVLESGIIPPNVNFEKPNRRIPVAQWNIQFPVKPTPWPAEGLRRISVNSFGVGGTNGHLILDDAYHYLQAHRLHGRHNTQPKVPSAQELERLLARLRGESSTIPNGLTNGHTNGNTNGHSNGHVSEASSRLVVLSSFDEDGVGRNGQQQAEYLEHFDQVSTDSDLVNSFAYTMNKRSVFPWRSFSIGASRAELAFSLKSPPKPLRVKNQPSLGFVFTGQGAQWYAMGRELLVYPLFAQRIRQADEYYKSLGASWSLIDELDQTKDGSRLNEPWLAHPSCTALQMAVVDLLESWGITPKRVVGHSSGEIAAAYCAGKLTQESAWKTAYYRGVVSAKQLTAKGSMIAVGLSPAELAPYLEQINQDGPGEIICACLNSPKNTTVSGDDDKIEVLQRVLNEKKVFARKLSVKNAYHSAHMKEVSAKYMALLGDLPKPTETTRASIEYFSTLTGEKIEDAYLPASYWVDNLVSPVKFMDGFLSMLSGKVQKGQATLKLNSSGRGLSIDLLLEIGPHSAMQSAVRENIATRSDAAAIMTLGLLNRSNANLANVLKSVGQLCIRGYPVDLLAVNQVEPGRVPSLMVQLPSYSFNHGERNIFESRLVKNYRLRKHPRHDLFGAPVSDWNQEHPRWRHYFNVEEQPWLRDHQITDSIIFPAVGYLIAALEALRQLTDPSNKIISFRFRDVSLKRAMIIPDDKEGVETSLSLTRMDESSLWGSAVWRRFQVSSYNPVGDDWIEHCTGYIAVDLETADGPIDNGRERKEAVTSWKKAIKDFSDRCVVPVDVESIYDNLVTSGVAFGPLFRNLSGLQGTVSKLGEASAFASVPDIASSMPKKFTHPHLIHPATLDPMLQLFLMSLLDLMGRKTLDRPLVPTFIKEAFVSADLDASPAYKYFGHSKSHLLAYDKYESDVSVYDASSQDLRVSFKGVRATFLDSSEASANTARALCHELTWAPHLESLTPSAFKNVPILDKEANEVYEGQVNRFQTATVLLILDALKELGDVPIDTFEGHYQRYYQWMLQIREWLKEDKISGVRLSEFQKIANDPAAKNKLLKSVASHNADGELAVRMGTNIVKVLRKEIEALHLMFGQDDLLDRVYGQVAHLGDLPALQNEYLKLVGESKTNLRILEVGAGTGSSTVPMLEQLTSVTSDGVLMSSRIETYTFTDVSAAFFEKAQEKFKSYRDIMEYKVLDAEKDIAEQSFDLGKYDFVVAQNVIHATKDLQATLGNIRKLLKPGGRLLLQEGVRQDFFWSGIAFGLLPGWWAGIESIRRWSPWVSIAQWNDTLKNADYTGIDLNLADRQDPKLHTQSLFVATSAPTKKQAVETAIITTKPLTEGFSPLVQKLKAHLENSVGVSTCSVVHYLDVYNMGLQNLQKTVCLSVMELERPVLENLNTEEFDNFRQMITICKGMLWVTGDALKTPAFAMIEGIARSTRWERDIEDANLVTLHISDDEKSQANIIGHIAQLFEKQFLNELPLSEINGEYAVKDGVVLTSRLVIGQGADDYLASKFSRPRPVMKPLKEAGRPIKLATAAPGLLDRLEWITDPTYEKPLKETQVEVDIKAVGLNFRDLMIAMGEHMAYSIGCEAAGVITRIGSNVKDYKVGDRVVYLTGHEEVGTFQTFGRVDQNAIVPIPDNLDYETAAGLPCVYATVIYGLVDAGRLEKGEKILIHAAAGGVGQAAIQFAQYKGAEVFATVSSPAKRELLMTEYGIPEDHIFSSRDLTFVQGVLRMTGGKGVDVVLNSLSGEALRSSWDLLAPFGRFIEIGKKDAQANGKVSLTPYLRNVTMASVELPTMMRHRPALIRRLTADAVELWKGGHIHAAKPTKIMTFSQIEEALRILQSGKGMGKIVMVPSPDDIVPIVPAQPPEYRLEANASYVISGGLGGIGRSMAVWMAERGARNLVLLSRSGNITDEVKEMMATLETKGCNVRIFKSDVSDRDLLRKTLEECKATLPPIKGVIQGAMTLDDTMFENMSYDSFQTAVKPKVQGSWNLHELLPKDLDFFLMLSSATGILGNRSQANYAAGNTFQDMLARHRRSLGLAGSTIDLGTVLAVGYVAKNRHRTQVARHLGTVLETLREDEIHALMEYCMDTRAGSPAQLISGLTNIATYRAKGMPPPTYMGYPLFTNLRTITASRSGRTDGSDGLMVEALLNAATSYDAATEIIQEAIIKKLSGLLAVPTDNIDPQKSISSNGVDSLVAMEFRAFLSKEVKADIPVLDIMGTLSLAAVARKAATISQAVEVQEGKQKN